MTIQSIYEKSVSNKGNKNFKGRLFYAIIPDSVCKNVSFYFSTANFNEGRSVARAIACFIEETLEMDASFYCSSDLIADCYNGEYDNSKRTFLTEGEKAKNKKLDYLQEAMVATNVAFISVAHQRAMATEDNSVASKDSRLTKGSKEPLPAKKCSADDISDMTESQNTGSTTDSKAQRFADAAVKQVTMQYSTTIKDLNSTVEGITSKLEERDDIIKALQEKLQVALGKELVDTDEEDNHQEDQQSVNDTEDKSTKDNDNKANENDNEHGKIHPLEDQDNANLIDDNADARQKSEQENDSTPINGDETADNQEKTFTDDVSLTDPVNSDDDNDPDNANINSPPRRQTVQEEQSPYRKGFDSKETYSSQENKEKENKKQKIVSPDPPPRRCSSRLRKSRSPTPKGGGGSAL